MLDAFEKHWKDLNKVIRCQKFDNVQVTRLLERHVEEASWVLFNCQSQGEIYTLTQITNEVVLAAEIAYSNYRTEQLSHRAPWSVSLFGNGFARGPRIPKLKRLDTGSLSSPK